MTVRELMAICDEDFIKVAKKNQRERYQPSVIDGARKVSIVERYGDKEVVGFAHHRKSVSGGIIIFIDIE